MSSLDQDDELEEQGDDDNRETESPPTGLRAWTARASSYVVSKMALLEQLGEGVGGYLLQPPVPPERTEFSLDPNDEEGTTSGATSGDDIWGTPTSGGPDDESFTASSVMKETFSRYDNARRYWRWLARLIVYQNRLTIRTLLPTFPFNLSYTWHM